MKSLGRWRHWAIRSYRLIAVAVAAVLIAAAHDRFDRVNSAPLVSLAEARRVFPEAARLGNRDTHLQAQVVLNAEGEPLGLVLQTSPETDDLIGYAGPSNLLVGISPQGRVVRVELLWSRDTTAHVDELRRATGFWKQFTGWQPVQNTAPPIEGVSGSTLTSLAMAEAVQRRLVGTSLSLRFPTPVTVEEARALFPAADRLEVGTPRPGWLHVRNDQGESLGYVLRTSPQADNVIGYGGPTEALLAVASEGETVTAVRLRTSYDTSDYVDRVRDDAGYLQQLAGRTLDEWADLDFRQAGIEGVSGATQTSFALAEGIRRRAQAERRAQAVSQSGARWFSARDVGLLAVVIAGLMLAFSPWKGRRWLRWLWQGVLMVAFGLWLGDLLSLALLAGWSRHGVPWQTAPSLAVMVAVSLLTPWGTRRQVYCSHLCPHGAAQEWLGRFRRLHVRLPKGLSRILSVAPGLLLAAAFVLAVAIPLFDLSQLEPFDAWVLKRAAAVPLVIAVVGLIASLFVPMAYCRFGCPTGYDHVRHIIDGTGGLQPMAAKKATATTSRRAA
ncbi:MAG: FMN-binding protein, partial [Planctomycetaceae bacterium]|nr:FMN-binding protein [Planctomycetaceae bacterium]